MILSHLHVKATRAQRRPRARGRGGQEDARARRRRGCPDEKSAAYDEEAGLYRAETAGPGKACSVTYGLRTRRVVRMTP
jgi:hypothetical protein